MWPNIEIFKEFAKHETLWTVEAFGENILTLLLKGESTISKECLLWLKNEIDPYYGMILDCDLRKIINTIGNSGSCALSLVSQLDWDGDEEKDEMISWLLSKGADITLMDPKDAEAYLDRYCDKEVHCSISCYRCITFKGVPGQGNFEMKILFKWINKKEKTHERFWIKDLCNSPRGDHYEILKY